MDKKYWYIGGFILLIVIGYMFLNGRSTYPTYASGSVEGPLHWHSKISIYINGGAISIPKELGVERQPHSPVHTHQEGDGTIHFEFSTPKVSRNMLTTGYFINQIWGKKFSEICILDYCNEGNKKVRMFVNGKENTEFEKYVMADKDRIEIRYE